MIYSKNNEQKITPLGPKIKHLLFHFIGSSLTAFPPNNIHWSEILEQEAFNLSDTPEVYP